MILLPPKSTCSQYCLTVDSPKGVTHIGPQSWDYQAQVLGFLKADQRDRYASGHTWGNAGENAHCPLLHVQMGLKDSKLCRNLCLLRGLNLTRSIVKHLTPCVSQISNNGFLSGLIFATSLGLNSPNVFDSRTSFANTFPSRSTFWKYVFEKRAVLQTAASYWFTFLRECETLELFRV